MRALLFLSHGRVHLTLGSIRHLCFTAGKHNKVPLMNSLAEEGGVPVYDQARFDRRRGGTGAQASPDQRTTTPHRRATADVDDDDARQSLMGRFGRRSSSQSADASADSQSVDTTRAGIVSRSGLVGSSHDSSSYGGYGECDGWCRVVSC